MPAEKAFKTPRMIIEISEPGMYVVRTPKPIAIEKGVVSLYKYAL
jgi:hypothetical protein